MNLLQRLVWCGVASGIFAATVAGQHAAGEISVARTSANQMAGHFEAIGALPIPRSVFPGIAGFASGSIGFESIPFDDETEGLFVLDPASIISAELVSVSPAAGVQVYDGLLPLTVGSSMQFGSPIFDYHPIFNIHAPGAVHGDVFELRFVFRDASGRYTPSDEMVVLLTPECIADYNASDDVSVQDIFDFLSDYFVSVARADVNASGSVTVQDVFDFLTLYFQSCD